MFTQHFFNAKTPSAQSFAEEILCDPQRSLLLCVEFLFDSGSAGLREITTEKKPCGIRRAFVFRVCCGSPLVDQYRIQAGCKSGGVIQFGSGGDDGLIV